MRTRRTRVQAFDPGNLLLLGASLLFVVLLLGAAEGALRVLGIGEPDASRTSRLKYQQVFLPILEPAIRPDGTAIYRTVDPRIPYQAILRDKPEASCRVFVFGGSAAAGLGFSPNVTFARNLERMLRAANPDRSVEVVNLGIVALSSRQVAVIVEDVATHFAPDLMIVYSGNNEYLEIHAEKYARKHARLLSNLRDRVGDTNLFRAVTRSIQGPPKAPSLADQDLSHDDLQLTQDRIIQDVSLSDAEVSDVLDEYERNITRIAESARRNAVPVLLLSVASNWEWRGRSDLPPDWIEVLTGNRGAADPRRALEILDEQANQSDPAELHEILFRRATVQATLGNHAAARDDFRRAMNLDPHLRRALDRANARVKAVAESHGTAFLDLVESLAARDPHGLVGFEAFYDYVHFTPRGAIWAAAAIFHAIRRQALLPLDRDFDTEAYVRAALAELDRLEADYLEVDDWLGVGSDMTRIRDRDLWKYDKMLRALDAQLEQDPGDFQAWVYRGNASFFQMDGAEEAEREYRKALAIREHPTVRRNLAILKSERPSTAAASR